MNLMTIELDSEVIYYGRLMATKGELPMRHELAKMVGQKHRFTGMFVRYGSRQQGDDEIKTLCISNICLRDRFTAHHIWFDAHEEWQELDLKYGDVVSFYAQVSPYVKNCFTEDGAQVTDYKLINESNIYLLRKRNERMADAEQRHRERREAAENQRAITEGKRVRAERQRRDGQAARRLLHDALEVQQRRRGVRGNTRTNEPHQNRGQKKRRKH